MKGIGVVVNFTRTRLCFRDDIIELLFIEDELFGKQTTCESVALYYILIVSKIKRFNIPVVGCINLNSCKQN